MSEQSLDVTIAPLAHAYPANLYICAPAMVLVGESNFMSITDPAYWSTLKDQLNSPCDVYIAFVSWCYPAIIRCVASIDRSIVVGVACGHICD